MKSIFIFLILFIPFFCFAQDEKKSSSPESETQSLKLTIKTDKEVYAVGDDIKVIYTIENTSSNPVSFYSSNPSFEFKVVDDKKYDETKYTYQSAMDSPKFKILQPNESWAQEKTIAYIRKGKVEIYDRIPSGKKGMPLEEIRYYDGFYIDIPDYYKKILTKDGFGNFSTSFKYCDGSSLIYCISCPEFFTKEDCLLLGTDLLHEKLKERRRQNWERIKDKLSADKYEMNKRYFLEEYDGYDPININEAHKYCDELKRVETAWKGCLDSNIVKIQIVEAKEH